jgi:hypothetical protein
MARIIEGRASARRSDEGYILSSCAASLNHIKSVSIKILAR